MPNVFANLPLPVMNGAGAAVDTSTMGVPKTIEVVGAFPGSTIAIEVSEDAGTTWGVITSFQDVGGKRVLNVVAQQMRLNVRGRKTTIPFSADAGVGAPEAAPQFGSIAMPVLNGAGAPLDISAFGVGITIVLAGSFPGAAIAFEISEDGSEPYAPLFAFSGQGGVKSAVVTANFIRANVQGRKAAVPFTAVAAIGAVETAGGGGSTGVGSNCLIYRPGSGSEGPVEFDDWAVLYPALQAMRADNNNTGCYTIMFDDTDESPAIIPAGTYDMTHVTWEGMWTAAVDISIPEGVVLQNLRQIQNYLRIRFTGSTPVITDLGVNRAEELYLGIGCSLEAETDPMIVYADDASSSSIVLDDGAYLNDAGSPVVATENEASDLRIDLIGAGSTVIPNTLEAAANTQITLYIQDDSAQVDETQTGIDGAAILEVNQITRVRLDPTPKPPLGPITVDTVVDDSNQLVLVDPSLAEDPNTVTITLPPAFNHRGQPIIVKNVTGSTNPIIVTAGLGDTIDGVANVSIETGLGFVQLVSDGVSVWRVVAVDDTDTDTSRSFLPEQWAASNIAALDTNLGMSAQVSTNFDTFVALRAGSLTGLVWRLSGGPITAGTLTVTVRKNGATVALAGVSTAGGNPTGGRTTIATGTVTYVAGDLIDVQYTCDAGFLPTASMNLESTVEVTQ